MSARDQRLTVNVTIDEAEQLAEIARSQDRSVSYVLRLAVLDLLRESAQGSTAEEVTK